MSQKFGEISPDGKISATVENYIDGKRSITKITVDFKGKTGSMIFQSNEEGEVDLKFESGDCSISANTIILASQIRTLISGNQALVDCDDELILAGGNKVDIKCLKGILNLISNDVLNIGSNRDINIETMKKLFLKALNEFFVKSNKVTIQSGSIRLGQSAAYPVARVGDKIVLTSSTSGVIVGPGSMTVFVD